jgi:large subunit ribosomal protein L9
MTKPNLELMLLQTVPHLGDPGDVVNVTKGYARNYLLPRKLAAPVSPDAVRQADRATKVLVESRAREVEEARESAAKIQDASVHVEAKAGEAGTLYGSVTAAMIAESLAKDGFAVEAKHVQLEHPIKELGIYDVEVKTHADVSATVKLYVVEPAPSSTDAEAAPAAS